MMNPRPFFILVPVLAATLAGCWGSNSVRVVDGDTIDIGRERVRLFGIDAPEISQTCFDAADEPYACGSAAAHHLRSLVKSSNVTCQRRGQHRGRTVAICFTESGDLAEALVRAGRAIEDRRYSDGRYAKAEREARDARIGVWAGFFETPWAYRERTDHRRADR